MNEPRKAPPPQTAQNPTNKAPQSAKRPDIAEIKTWIATKISQYSNIPIEKVDPTREIFSYGIDSSALLMLMGELEDWLNIKISTPDMEKYPTIEKLATYLIQETQ